MGEFEQVHDKQQSAAPKPAESSLQLEAQDLLAQSVSTPVRPSAPTDDPYLRAKPSTVGQAEQLPYLPFSDRLTPSHPGVFAPPVPPLASCPRSMAYENLITKAARNMYDPSPLARIPDLKTKFNCQIKTDADALKFANEILRSTGDPYNAVIMPVESKAVKRERQGREGDIGATFQRIGDNLVISSLAPGSGAEKAGLRVGDTMAYVNGQNVSRASERDLRNKITGADGTTLSVKVIRDGKLVELNVERTEKEVLTVHDRMLPNGVLYLKVDAMDNEAQPDQLKAAIERHPDAKSYVLDLRDNIGGLLNSSLKMASLFVDKGNLLTISRRVDSDPDNPQYSRKNYVLTPGGISVTSSLDPGVRPDSQMARFKQIVDKPVAILVNEKTASSAEILAAALHENGVGTIIGGTTYGKGIGQTIFSGMPGGSSLKLTTFRFLSPQGHWFGDGNTNRQGIQSDIKVKNVPGTISGTSADLQLIAARQFLQSKQK